MSQNIILVGPPGCGKSTIGKILAKTLQKGFIDIDDYMEERNKRSVGSILDELGDNNFLIFEEKQTLEINVENHIIATTGSSPLRKGSMEHLRKKGVFVYIDVPLPMIEARLEEMKVDRIVGMKTQSLGEILRWRKEKFYDQYEYDIHIKLTQSQSSLTVTGEILSQLNHTTYHSTRGDQTNYPFSKAVLKGLAPDGGLLIPNYMPTFPEYEIEELRNLNYKERAVRIFKSFGTDFELNKIKSLVNQAYGDNFDTSQIAPLKNLKPQQYLLELWHGPTSAFKDMALQFKPLCFEESIQIENNERAKEGKAPKNYLILAATSGDTGKAALEGYKDKAQVKIAVFYPQNGVSEVQRKQMQTQTGNNVEVYGIDGNFDDAQSAVKHMFSDAAFNEELNRNNIYISSANSINWGRILPQIFYYISAYCDLVNQNTIQNGDLIDVAVPTGNFGNILAAFYAKKMGIPIDKLICASNQNNVLTDFIQTGTYDLTQRTLVKTPSPSMDILVSSNLERLLYELTQDSAKIKQWMQELKENKKFSVDSETLAKIQNHFIAGKCDNQSTLKQIKAIYDETKYVMDPHTAVVQKIVEDYLSETKSQKPIIIAATAHWAKFGSDVYRALHEMKHDDAIETKNEFEILYKIKEETGDFIPKNLFQLENMENLHTQTCSKEIEVIEANVKDFACKN